MPEPHLVVYISNGPAAARMKRDYCRCFPPGTRIEFIETDVFSHICDWIDNSLWTQAYLRERGREDLIRPLEVEEAQEGPICQRCKRPGQPPHTCPYAEEINGDSETLCTCCAECRQECCYEI